MGWALILAFTPSTSYDLSAQGSEQPLRAWWPLLGELKGMSLCCTGPGPHLLPKDVCSVASSMCSFCLCVSACLILSLTVPVISLSLFLSSSPQISGDVAQACDSLRLG